MTLADLFTNLSLGVLSNTALGQSGEGDLADKHKPKAVLHANAGLLALYSRFILKEKEVFIEQQEGRTTYHLDSKYALSKWDGTSEPEPYIQDTGEPFQDDVIKVLGVSDSLHRTLPINDENRKDSIFTKNKTLRVPRAVPRVYLAVRYQAKHPPLVVDNLEQELELPDVLQDALSEFIAWKIYANMNTQESTAKAQEHQVNYENICEGVVLNDTVNTSISSTNNNFERRGWV